MCYPNVFAQEKVLDILSDNVFTDIKKEVASDNLFTNVETLDKLAKDLLKVNLFNLIPLLVLVVVLEF